MSAKNVQVAQFPDRSNNTVQSLPEGAIHVGQLVSVLGDDQVAVAVPGRESTLPARLALPLSYARLQTALECRQGVVIVLDAAHQAFVIGFLEPVPVEPPTPSAPQVVEADVDGRRVRVVGQDEIVLECGSASITLRRNGRVIIKGTYVETDSAGTNRIKGAAVRIN